MDKLSLWRCFWHWLELISKCESLYPSCFQHFELTSSHDRSTRQRRGSGTGCRPASTLSHCRLSYLSSIWIQKRTLTILKPGQSKFWQIVSGSQDTLTLNSLLQKCFCPKSFSFVQKWIYSQFCSLFYSELELLHTKYARSEAYFQR